MSIIWTIIIGFVAGVIAKFLMPGRNEPSGFILTTILGVVGAFVATYLGHALGWYRADQGAGLIGAVVGAVIVLAIWGLISEPQHANQRFSLNGPGRAALMTTLKESEEVLREHGCIPPYRSWRC